MAIRKAVPGERQTKVSQAITLVLFVGLPAAAIWLLRDVLPGVVWWACVIALCGWVVHLVSFESVSDNGDQPAPSPAQDERPWQERVDEVERNRSIAVLDVRCESPIDAPPSSFYDEPGDCGKLPVDDALHEHLQRLIDAGQWDAARSVLQKIAYTMPDATVEEKLAFAEYVKDFAALDPLFNTVLSTVLPVVQAKPGIKQTEVYALVPDQNKETTRYVLYYAHVLALIERKKKGSTYQLFPFVEGVSERWDVALSRKLVAAEKSKPTHRQMRKEMWAHRLPQLQESIERRPYWQFRVVGDSRDPPACKALDGRVERHDSEFWQTNAPWVCRREECRCTVRAYTLDELLTEGIAIPK
jgi:hypothetical protein